MSDVKTIGKRRAARIARRISKYGDGPVPTEKKFRHRKAPHGKMTINPNWRESGRFRFLHYGSIFG